MEENTFWITLWRSVLIALCIIVAIMAGCTMNNDRLIAEAIKNGADPIAANCAFEGFGHDAGRSLVCNKISEGKMK